MVRDRGGVGDDGNVDSDGPEEEWEAGTVLIEGVSRIEAFVTAADHADDPDHTAAAHTAAADPAAEPSADPTDAASAAATLGAAIAAAAMAAVSSPTTQHRSGSKKEDVRKTPTRDCKYKDEKEARGKAPSSPSSSSPSSKKSLCYVRKDGWRSPYAWDEIVHVVSGVGHNVLVRKDRRKTRRKEAKAFFFFSF